MSRKVTIFEKALGKREGLPPITPRNFPILCARCHATLGGHLGYRCIDDQGEFLPYRLEQMGQ
jgi:hypothetical protein